VKDWNTHDVLSLEKVVLVISPAESMAMMESLYYGKPLLAYG
jgi:hypothetical protein